MNDHEREALQQAVRGDYSALNELEFEAAKKRVEINTDLVDLHGFWVQEYRIVGYLVSGIGRMYGLKWKAGSVCRECEGRREACLSGKTGNYWVDCPACGGEGEDEETEEILTDLEGNIFEREAGIQPLEVSA